MRSTASRLHTLLFVCIGLGLTALGLVAYATDAFRDLELDTVDARFSVRGDQRAPADIVVVAIDDTTFQELDQQWPFARATHARAIDRLAADGPRAIAYDVQFTERADRAVALAEAVLNARGRVVLATTEVDERGRTNILGGDEVLREIGATPGNGLLPQDPGGVLRRFGFSVDGLKSFAVATAEVVTREKVDPEGFDEDGAWIDYRGPPGTFATVSFSRVVQGRMPRGFFRDKIVVVGPSAPSLQDIHPTSTTGDDEMIGAEIQANAIATVLRGVPLRSVPAGIDAVLIVLLGLLAPFASLRLPTLRALSLALTGGIVFLVGAYLAFRSGRIVSVVYPLGTLVVTSVGSLVIQYVTTAFERQRTRDVFARFVPEDVVDAVLATADSDLRLGGVQRDATVLFSDLRGFTTFAESMPPDRVIQVLNRYLSEMSDAILDNGGTLVAYMGDGIMAVFGAPIVQDDHADRALAAARSMLFERLPRFNEWLRSEGMGDGFRMGIGLNSGPVMSGNVGSERRMEYTAIGDTTNTAARLEGMTKDTPHQLLAADSTCSRLKDPATSLVYVGEVEVRGRQAKVRLWSIAE